MICIYTHSLNFALSFCLPLHTGHNYQEYDSDYLKFLWNTTMVLDTYDMRYHMRFVWIYATYAQPTVKYVRRLNFVSSNFLSWWPSESSRAVLVVPRFYFPMTNTFRFPGSRYTYHGASESKYLWPFALFVWWMGRLDSVIMMAKSSENSYWWHIASLLSSNSWSIRKIKILLKPTYCGLISI